MDPPLSLSLSRLSTVSRVLCSLSLKGEHGTPTSLQEQNHPTKRCPSTDTSAYPREHEQLKEIRAAILKKYDSWAGIAVPVDQGLFLSMLLKIMNAKKTLEIGVFTGYSLLTTARALPDDGKIIAIDVDEEAYEIGLPSIRKAGVEHKISFIHGDAMSVVNKMTDDGAHIMEFDFAFVDAEKVDYIHYHEKLMKLVKIGGIIAYDNTLWFGTVVQDGESLPDRMRDNRNALIELNSFLAADPRIELSQLSIGDGVTLCKRLH